MQVFVDDVHSPRVVVEVRPVVRADTGRFGYGPAVSGGSVVVDRWGAVEWHQFYIGRPLAVRAADEVRQSAVRAAWLRFCAGR